MASTSKIVQPEKDDEEEAEEEEVEHFDDFTLASSWERFISEIEAISRQWLADGPKNLLEKGAVQVSSSENIYKVKHELKHASKSYCMEYHFETKKKGNVEPWDLMLHDLQLSFGVNNFLVIQPQSASGVVLDAPEATKLLSAVAIASSNSSSFWPAFVPVHDPSREAYIGIQNMGTVFTRRFEADRLASQVPVKFMHLEGLYELFVSKYAFSILDLSVHLFRVHFRMRLTYQMIPYDDDDEEEDMLEADAENTGSIANTDGDTQKKTQWDDDCPWSEWYSAEEPVEGFDLITTWSEKVVESSSDMAELENATPHEAEKWYLIPNINLNLDSSEGNRVGFASQLNRLVNALEVSFQAKFMEDFVSAENLGGDNLKSSMIVPAPTVLDRVLKELFHEGGQIPNAGKDKNKYSRAIKGASHESLFAQFCLHALWFGNCNIRALAVLWIEYVREVRWCWEELQPLPRMPIDASIDLSTCLINQKLQMLAICIEKKRELTEEFLDCLGSNDEGFAAMEEDDLAGEDSSNLHASAQKSGGKRDSSSGPDSSNESKTTLSKFTTHPANMSTGYEKPSYSIRRGSAGPVGSMKLLKSCQSLHAPFTQDAPIMTEDMHEERLQAVEAFGDSFNFSAQLEKDVLFSDMSAFKAANPDAVFEDFIRWHSPGDWVDDKNGKSGQSENVPAIDVKNDWPPGGQLSERMSEHGNLWQKIWNDAPALQASEQKHLLDPNREGEKVLHYLETLRPHQLLEQMVCTAFRASADTLNKTNFGGLKQMKMKMDQLDLTMASSLRPLQTNQLSSNSEAIEDLRRLCVVFDHVEKLLTLAAYLHRKFLQAPRVCEAIFSEYHKFYLPSMGMGSVEVDSQKEFDMKLLLRMKEREVVSNMFAPPTANQSWRKVLSMGNLLNGHEPVVREIIFSTRDTLSDFHYAASTSKVYEEELETYRMYIRGTANDIRVALSVISSD